MDKKKKLKVRMALGGPLKSAKTGELSKKKFGSAKDANVEDMKGAKDVPSTMPKTAETYKLDTSLGYNKPLRGAKIEEDDGSEMKAVEKRTKKYKKILEQMGK